MNSQLVSVTVAHKQRFTRMTRTIQKNTEQGTRLEKLLRMQ